MSNVITLCNLSKTYGKQKVLDQFNLEIQPGEVIGLVGANGSGKSTLFNILSGSEKIQLTGGYEGSIQIGDSIVNITTPQEASQLGIGLVHQELSLFENMDAGTNIMLTREIVNWNGLIDRSSTHVQAANTLESLGIHLPVNKKVHALPLSYKQFIEIAREISKTKLRLILMDEPTSSLNSEEVALFLSAIASIKESGTSIIFVSHRLEEVCEISDRIIVLRDGKTISQYQKTDYNIQQLALDMIGQDVVKAQRLMNHHKTHNLKENILTFDVQKVSDDHRVYKPLHLTVKKGEVIGVTGLAGHGQSIFSEILSANVPYQGSVIYEGRPLNLSAIRNTLQSGIAILPEDRKGKSLLLNRSIERNLTFTALHLDQKYLKFPKLKKLSPIDRKKITKDAAELIEAWQIKCTDSKQFMGELSGGNQQKACLARVIMTAPKFLLIGEPTRGIDLHAKEAILNTILRLNEEENMTVMIASSELDELRRVCDRIVIMYEGGVQCILEANAPIEDFSLAIAGQAAEKEFL